MEIVLQGIGVAPGIAIGPALPYRVRAIDVPKYHVKDPVKERERFDAALEEVREDIRALRERTRVQAGPHQASIFDAHLLIADDVDFHSEINERLKSEKVNVEYLVDDYIKKTVQLLNSLNDTMIRERARDIHDVGNRIMEKLLRVEYDSLDHLERPSIIVAHDLTPSDTANLDLANALAIVMDLGGATSHTAILARAFEIPAVVGLKRVGAYAFPGDILIVDGSHGTVYVRPDEKTITRYRKRQVEEQAERKAIIETARDQASITLDGREITLQANIELPAEVERALEVNAQGVGLFRTEYLFLNRPNIPTEEEQYQAFVSVAAAVKPDSVTFRTLDLGGDKIAMNLQVEHETNPQLGWRAIRLCLERTDIFKAQLRALYRASVHGTIKIMFPLITGIDELRQVKQIVQEVQEELAEDGIAFRRDVPLGIMIEVPSAVAIADLLAKEADFFSIGTNDLVQYALAVDRVNERIAHMFEHAHPAILRMLHQTIKAAKAANIPVSICGEMAGNPIYTELLVGLGVDSLSMSAVSIPVVRGEVAKTRASTAARFARKLLTYGTVPEIKAQLKRRFDRKRANFWYLSQFERYPLEDTGNSDESDED